MTALEVYNTSDGSLTRAFYADLEARGPIGLVAMNLMRAQKGSARAKLYRGGIRGQGSYKGMAYDRKNWAMQNLCKVLMEHSKKLGIGFGWKEDPGQEYHNWVLYVDTAAGQVSFHSAGKGKGPLYRGEWDKTHLSAERVIAFCDLVASMEVASGAGAAVTGESSEPAAPPVPTISDRRLKFGDPDSIARARSRG